MRKQEKSIDELRNQYGCNGFCYGGIDENGDEVPICPSIDTCEETRVGEGIALALVILSSFAACVGLGIGVLYYLFKWLSKF